jgi:putative ABC transport system substrate-binding protein
LAELHRLTNTIPVVFTQVSDPVGSGFVASLARPGGNISGFQNFEPSIGGKWLGVLKEAAPNIRRAAILFGSDSIAENKQAVTTVTTARVDRPSIFAKSCIA